MANDLIGIFTPIIGQIAWQIRRGYGSCLMMEFGKPHIEIRNPIVSKSLSSYVRVRQNAAKRRATLRGQWGLYITTTD